ncbi:MAG: hypothetical protein RR891_10030 [Clostridium sp.]|uniref:hypothetical protein n=1 Tax=Clostridium sp. TaxID=1506 RepID=UPI00305E90C1
MKSKKIAIYIISLICIGFFMNLIKEDIWDKNEKLLRKNVLSIDESVEIVDLSDIAPFNWDLAYSFAPYTREDDIYETVGYKWDNIVETVNEGMNQIVFLKDKKVVCYLYGYADNNGYGINFGGEGYKDGVNVLNLEDNLKFQVVRRDGVVYLEQINLNYSCSIVSI